MKLLGKIICWATGKHRRGKRVGAATDIATGRTNYYCPRCGARWSRRANVKAAG